MEHLSYSEQETEQLGEQVARRLPRGTVIAYTGELGMGKTAFTRGLARGLGCRGRVTSPTFTIVNEYEGDIPLFHFDLYRLGSSDELFDIGWEDYLARGGVCAVEWSERAEDAFDGSTVRIDFRRGAQHDGSRVSTCTGVAVLRKSARPAPRRSPFRPQWSKTARRWPMPISAPASPTRAR